jgi:4-amino-4-deoxy-L-arabinose transferase-like glycosyltransferase
MESSSPSRVRRAGQFHQFVIVIISCVILVVIASLLLMRSLGRGINHDEHQFVASGALLARHGLLPYRDYPYFHVPNLTFLYGLIFWFTPGAYLLAARALSALCAILLAAIIFLLPFQIFRNRALWARLALGALSVALLIFSPMFTYTSGRAWNHDLPALLTVTAFLLHLHGAGRSKTGVWFFLSGFAVGAAAFTRLSFILLIVPFIVFIFMANAPWRRNIVLSGWFLLGVSAAAIPTIYTAAQAPAAFYFGNVEYARLNTLFRKATGYRTAMTLTGKLITLTVDWLLMRPGNLFPVLVFAICSLPHSLRPRIWRTHPVHPFLLLILLSLFIGALGPTPSWSQYYFALFPFLVISALYGLADFHPGWLDRKLFWGIIAGIVCISALLSLDEYRHIRDLFRPDNWYVAKVQESSADVSRLVGKGERVLTNAPIYALEGGLDVYPEFATGPFAMRVAALLSEEQQEQFGFTSSARMERLLADAPPRAVLVEVDPAEADDPAAEKEVTPLREYAAQHAYAPFELNDELTLWLRPLVEWGGSVRLLHHEIPQREIAPGSVLPLILFLDSRQPISNNLNIIVRVMGSNGVEVARSDGWPWGRPTSTWQPGDVWYDGHELAIPGDLEPGVYRLEVSFYDPATGVTLPITTLNRGTSVNGWLLMDVLYVESGDDGQQADTAAKASLGGMIDLLGARLGAAEDAATPDGEVSARPGDRLFLNLTWQARTHVGVDYTVFLHLLDSNGNLVAQWDRQPLSGFVPTSLWKNGDTFTDEYALDLPPELPPGDYRLVAGMYRLDTLERLPIEVDGAMIGDALEFDLVRVR